MKVLASFLKSTVGRKVIMALTGLALVLFVFGHMAGNLQVFLGPDAINAYAHKLQSLPFPVLWGFRLGLLAVVAVHIWAAVSLTLDNRRARPEGYRDTAYVQATYAARTMRWSGVILFAFIVFHIAHFTVRVVPENYNETIAEVPLVKHGEVVTRSDGSPYLVHDVHAMMVKGFSHWWVSAFYLVAMALLCLHLTHGVSSMFQTVGLRNKVWRKRLDRFAQAYGWVVFLGFASIPAAVLAGLVSSPALERADAGTVPAQVEPVDVNVGTEG
jgi:succinate dehydrogenase / fumarate reductase cytochrome b subunit